MYEFHAQKNLNSFVDLYGILLLLCYIYGKFLFCFELYTRLIWACMKWKHLTANNCTKECKKKLKFYHSDNVIMTDYLDCSLFFMLLFYRHYRSEREKNAKRRPLNRYKKKRLTINIQSVFFFHSPCIYNTYIYVCV